MVDLDGTVRGNGSAEYPVLRPQPGWAEQDPDTWWEATSTAVQQAVGWSGTGVSISGVGFSGQMHGAVFLGENERVLSPAVIWADQRSSRQASEVTAKIGAKREWIERRGFKQPRLQDRRQAADRDRRKPARDRFHGGHGGLDA